MHDGRGEVSAASSTEFLDSGLVNESSHLRPPSVHCGVYHSVTDSACRLSTWLLETFCVRVCGRAGLE